MRLLWCCIALAMLSSCECLVEVHTPVHYSSGVTYLHSAPVLAVTPAPSFYYAQQSTLQDSPIHVSVQNDVVYADKETHNEGPSPTNPHYPISYTRTNSNSPIISSTFYGKASLSSLPHPPAISAHSARPIKIVQNGTATRTTLDNQVYNVDVNVGSQTVSLAHDQDVNIIASHVPTTTSTPFDQDNQQPVLKTTKYKVRRPAIRKQFYDIEERIIIRPIGSAVVELDEPISQDRKNLPAEVDNKDPIEKAQEEDIEANKANSNQQYFSYEFENQKLKDQYLPPRHDSSEFVSTTPAYIEEAEDPYYGAANPQYNPSNPQYQSPSASEFQNPEFQNPESFNDGEDDDNDSVVIEARDSIDNYNRNRGSLNVPSNENITNSRPKTPEFGVRLNKLSRFADNPRHINCEDNSHSHSKNSRQESSNYINFGNTRGYFPVYQNNPTQQTTQRVFVPETPEEAELIPDSYPNVVSRPRPRVVPNQPRETGPQNPGVFFQYPSYGPQYYPGFSTRFYPQYPSAGTPTYFPQLPRGFPSPGQIPQGAQPSEQPTVFVSSTPGAQFPQQPSPQNPVPEEQPTYTFVSSTPFPSNFFPQNGFPQTPVARRPQGHAPTYPTNNVPQQPRQYPTRPIPERPNEQPRQYPARPIPERPNEQPIFVSSTPGYPLPQHPRREEQPTFVSSTPVYPQYFPPRRNPERPVVRVPQDRPTFVSTGPVYPQHIPQDRRTYPERPVPEQHPTSQQPRQFPARPVPERPVERPRKIPQPRHFPDVTARPNEQEPPVFVSSTPANLNPSDQQPRHFPEDIPNEQPVFVSSTPRSFIPSEEQPQHIPLPRVPAFPQFPQAHIPIGPNFIPVRPIPGDTAQHIPFDPRFATSADSTTTSAVNSRNTEEPRFENEPEEEMYDVPDSNEGEVNDDNNDDGNTNIQKINPDIPNTPNVEAKSNGVPIDVNFRINPTTVIPLDVNKKDSDTPIVITRKNTPQESQDNQDKYIRLLTGRKNIAEIGFGGRPCDDDKDLDAGIVRTRVLSATPAPPNAEPTGEHVSHRRIVVSSPFETVQEIEVVEPVRKVPRTRSQTNKPDHHNVPVYTTPTPPAFS